MSSRSANVSSQAGADLNALFGEIADAVAAAPLPLTPPGIAEEQAQQFAMTHLPARQVIDQQIVEVEERLDRRISQWMVEMNDRSSRLEQLINRLLSASAPVVAAAAYIPPAAEAAPLEIAAMDDQAKSAVTQPQPLPSIVVDPWTQRRAAALENQLQLQGNPAELPEVARGVGQPLRAPHPKEVERPTKYDGSSAQWRLWSASFKSLLR